MFESLMKIHKHAVASLGNGDDSSWEITVATDFIGVVLHGPVAFGDIDNFLSKFNKEAVKKSKVNSFTDDKGHEHIQIILWQSNKVEEA